MSKIVESLDYLSMEPKLYIHHKSNFKTPLGAFLSFAAICFTLGFSCYLLADLFFRKIACIKYSQTSTNQHYFNMSNFPVAFTLIDKYGNLIDREGVYNIIVEHRVNGFGNTTATTIELEPCNKVSLGEYQDLFTNKDALEKALCLPMDKYNITIFGKYGQATGIGYSMLNFYINKCVNNNNDKITCKDSETIENLLKDVYLLRMTVDYDIDHNNIDNPFKLIYLEDVLAMGTGVYNRHFIKNKKVVYITDYGYAYNNPESKENTQFGSTTSMIVGTKSPSQKPGNFARVTFIMDDKVDYFERDFIKMQLVLACLGGVFQFFHVLATFINSIISPHLYHLSLINKTFTFIEEKPKPRMENTIVLKNYMHETRRTNAKAAKGLRLKAVEFILPCFRNKTFDKLKNEIILKLNIDNIIKMMIDVDRLKDLLLNTEQKKQFEKKLYYKNYMQEEVNLNSTELRQNSISPFKGQADVEV
jgi:hypothetical protein